MRLAPRRFCLSAEFSTDALPFTTSRGMHTEGCSRRLPLSAQLLPKSIPILKPLAAAAVSSEFFSGRTEHVENDRDRQVSFICFSLCAFCRFASGERCRQLPCRSPQGKRLELPDVPWPGYEESADAHHRNLYDVPSEGRACEKDRKGQAHQPSRFSALRPGLGVHELPYGSYGARKLLQSMPPV